MTQGIGRFSGRLVGRRKTAMRQDWRYKRFKIQGGHCAYCGTMMVIDATKFDAHRLCTLDHKTPLSRDGIDHWENCVAACRKCNETKGDMTEGEFLVALQHRD